MVLDLFSSFDPTTKILSLKMSLNWLSSMLGLMFLPYIFWMSSNRMSMIFSKLFNGVSKEFKLVLSGNLYGAYFMFISLFTWLLFNNLLGMFPYLFTATSHLVMTLLISLTLWCSFMMFGWTQHTTHMLAHLVPNGTPSALMPFMVCIETISNVIRSGTLAVRLSANMISGHLLLCLMGNQGFSLPFILMLLLVLAQILLILLEFSVAFIQSYVFSILSALYSSETQDH